MQKLDWDLVWKGEIPNARAVERTRTELAELLSDGGLARPADLTFHTVFLSSDLFDGPCVVVTGESDDRFHAEYHSSAEMTSLADCGDA